MFYNEHLYHLLCSCTNPLFWKMFVPEIWAKMFAANQIAGFFSQRYLQNRSINLGVDASSHKLMVDQKIFLVIMAKNGHDQSGCKALKLTVSQEWIDGMSWYFACWWKFRKAKSCFNDFWVGIVRNGHDHLVQETLKSAVYKEWVYEFSWFFACWLWGSNFWLDLHCTLYLWLLNASLLQLYLLDP